MNKYSKAIVATAGAVAVFGQSLADGSISTGEWGLIATAVATAAGVWAKRNATTSVVPEVGWITDEAWPTSLPGIETTPPAESQ